MPREGSRYDFYLAFDYKPFLAEDYETGERYRSGSLCIPLNIYHREKFWCYPYQSPIPTGRQTDLFTQILGGGSQLYQIQDYASFFFTIRLEDETPADQDTATAGADSTAPAPPAED